MQFRRSGQRDERRRRVLIDEATGDSGQVASSQPSSGDHSGYTESARLENQPRLTDLIPQQLRTWLLLVLLAAAAIYGLQQASSRLLTGSEEVVNRFGLDGPGTLAAWYSSGLLLVAAGGCLMVYLVRRHKVDDYRGHYRLWLWVSAWCLVASLETATEIHRSLQAAVMGLAGSLSAEELNWGWLIAVSLGGLVLGVRISIEVRKSYWTNCFWLPAVAAYLAVMLLAFDVSWIHHVVKAPLTGGLLLLIAHTALAGMVWMEARHVFRDAQGLIPAKKVKARSVSEPVEESPRQVPVASAPVFTDPEDKEYLLADDPVDQVVEENWLEETDDLEEQRIRRKQQRAERKRLRRQQRKDRRRRVA
ncbi:MAG: hypothetical protein VB912_10375 [Pirellulaceae bacterium]